MNARHGSLLLAFVTALETAACGTGDNWGDAGATDAVVDVGATDATRDVAADAPVVDATLDVATDGSDVNASDASPVDASPADVPADISLDVPTSCPAGFADCNALASDGCEVNTLTDPAHCGACANACGAGEICGGGTCAASTCGSQCNACCPGVTPCNGGLRCAAGACQPPAYDGGPPLC